MSGSAAGQTEPKLSVSGGASGLAFYQTGDWGVVRSGVENPGPDAAAPLLAVNLVNPGNIQFCNRVWLPPKSRRVVYTPVLPLKEGGNDKAFELQSRLILEDTAGRERAEPPEPSLLLKRKDRFNSGLITDADDDWPRKLQTVLREASGLTPTSSYLRPSSTPMLAAGWRALDGLLIAQGEPDLGLDPARFNAMRQWLLDGGRLWIMLDQVDPAMPAALLGENWDVVVIDRVALTDFTIEWNSGRHEATFDYSVEMLRVEAPSFEVTQTVRGYPVSMRKRVGRGELLVTTLAARGWLDADGGKTTAIKPINWFVRKTAGAESTRHARADAFEGFVSDQIGYTILGRRPVVTVLAVFAGLILLVGLGLARIGRLEYAGLLGVVLALASAGVLIGAGLAQQGSTPTTVASAQLVRFSENQPYAQVTGLMSVYTAPADAGRTGVIEGRDGGVAWPDLSIQGGNLLRLIWTDPDHYRLEKLVLPVGAVRSIHTSNAVAIDDPPVAVITFDERGVVGRLDTAILGPVEDTLIATTTGRLAPRFDPAQPDRFVATREDALAPGAYLAADIVLDQTQIERQDVYRRLLGDVSFPAQPSLLGWAQPMTGGVSYTAEALPRGAALAVIPLKIERPTAGTRITVPAALLAMSPFRKQGLDTMPIYDPAKGTWVANVAQEATVLMRFDPPKDLQPMRVDLATLTLHLKAPGRSYDIVTYHGGELHTITGGSNPHGRIVVELKNEDAPAPLEDGGIVVGVRVGPFSDPSKQRGWSLSHMDLSVTGATE